MKVRDFGITKGSGNSYKFMFRMDLHIDDAPALEYIKTTFLAEHPPYFIRNSPLGLRSGRPHFIAGRISFEKIEFSAGACAYFIGGEGGFHSSFPCAYFILLPPPAKRGGRRISR